jgi:hypothetical protein
MVAAILVLNPRGGRAIDTALAPASPATSPVLSPADQVLQAYQLGQITAEVAVTSYSAYTTAAPTDQVLDLWGAGLLTDDEAASMYSEAESMSSEAESMSSATDSMSAGAASMTTAAAQQPQGTIYWWWYRPGLGGRGTGSWIVWPGNTPNNPTILELPPFASPRPLPSPTPWPGYYQWNGTQWVFVDALFLVPLLPMGTTVN